MTDETIDVEATGLSVVKPAAMVRAAPGASDEIADALQEYKKIQSALDRAMPDCIMQIRNKQFRKKDYWRAVKTAFNLSVEMISEELQKLDEDWGYVVTYKATAPNGAAVTGDGACFASEKIVYRTEWEGGSPRRLTDSSGEWIIDQQATKSNATVHNVRGHAHTRAFNRAVSNLVGFGEVSADELTDEMRMGARAKPKAEKPLPQRKTKPATEKQEKMLFAIACKRAQELEPEADSEGVRIHAQVILDQIKSDLGVEEFTNETVNAALDAIPKFTFEAREGGEDM